MNTVGLKARLVLVKFAKDATGYITHDIDQTILFPTAQKHLDSFFQIGLPHLFRWKVIITLSNNVIFLAWYLLLLTFFI
jgi:hypothetical protein